MIRDITYIGEGLIPAPNDGPALRYDPLLDEDVTDIAVHQWTGFLPPETWTTGEEIAYIVRVDGYHRTGRGLDGIGYQVCPFPSGRVYITARLDKYGAHVGGENDHLIGIGLPGTFNLNIPSPKHLEGCREAVRFIYEFLGREVPTTPHLNWGGTTCPGDRWREWVPQLQEDDMANLDNEDRAWIQAQFKDQTRGILEYVEKAHRVTRSASNNAIAALPTGTSGGATQEEVKEAVKDANREGTG